MQPNPNPETRSDPANEHPVLTVGPTSRSSYIGRTADRLLGWQRPDRGPCGRTSGALQPGCARQPSHLSATSCRWREWAGACAQRIWAATIAAGSTVSPSRSGPLEIGDVLGLRRGCWLLLPRGVRGRPEPSHPSIIGSAVRCGQVLGRILMVASRPVTVLIQGETGVGKELVARAIHDDRRGGGTLRRSRLQRPDGQRAAERAVRATSRAHSRAPSRSAPGLVEAARGGTLFLDEIGRCLARLQACCCVCSTCGSIGHVGSDVPAAHGRARFIGSQPRRLWRKPCARNRFRADLFGPPATLGHLPCRRCASGREDIIRSPGTSRSDSRSFGRALACPGAGGCYATIGPQRSRARHHRRAGFPRVGRQPAAAAHRWRDGASDGSSACGRACGRASAADRRRSCGSVSWPRAAISSCSLHATASPDHAVPLVSRCGLGSQATGAKSGSSANGGRPALARRLQPFRAS